MKIRFKCRATSKVPLSGTLIMLLVVANAQLGITYSLKKDSDGRMDSRFEMRLKKQT